MTRPQQSSHPPSLLLTRRSLLLATSAASSGLLLNRSARPAFAAEAPAAAATATAVAVAVPRGVSASDALHEALVGRALDRVTLVLDPGATYDGSLVVDLESRPFSAPPPDVSIVVGASGSSSSTTPTPATLRVDTPTPYVRVLEVRGEGARLRAENVIVRHASKSVASNYAVLASAGAALELVACDVSSSTGAGVAIDGAARVVLLRCALSNCARQGLAAFGGSRAIFDEVAKEREGERESEGEEGEEELADGDSTAVTWVDLDECQISGNGGDGLLVRDGAALQLLGACVVEGNGGAGLRWSVLEEREALVASAVAAAAGRLKGGGRRGAAALLDARCRFGRNSKGDVVVDAGNGAGDDRAAASLAAALHGVAGGDDAAVAPWSVAVV
jgi:hypothetical protein